MNAKGSDRLTQIVLVALAAGGVAFFALPLAGLLIRSPWSQLSKELTSSATIDAARLSAIVSVAAVALSTLFGFPLAWFLARSSIKGTRFIRALVLIPMVLPPVVGGIALFTAFGRDGLLGHALASAGVSLPFTTGAAIVAATFVSAPFLIIAFEAGLRSIDTGLEDAAASMGAGPVSILRTVTIPAMRPALIGGLALCWARALGEFGATITFAGNFQGRTQTLPLDIYQTLQSDPQGAVMLSVILLAVAVAIFVSLHGRLRFG